MCSSNQRSGGRWGGWLRNGKDEKLMAVGERGRMKLKRKKMKSDCKMPSLEFLHSILYEHYCWITGLNIKCIFQKITPQFNVHKFMMMLRLPQVCWGTLFFLSTAKMEATKLLQCHSSSEVEKTILKKNPENNFMGYWMGVGCERRKKIPCKIRVSKF